MMNPLADVDIGIKFNLSNRLSNKDTGKSSYDCVAVTCESTSTSDLPITL